MYSFKDEYNPHNPIFYKALQHFNQHGLSYNPVLSYKPENHYTIRWYSSKKLPQIPSTGIQRLSLSMEVDVCSSFFLYLIMSILCKRWTIFFLFLKLFTMEKEFPKNIRLPFPRALTSLFDRYGVILPQSRTRALQDNPYRLL